MKRSPHILLICTDEQAPQYMGCMGDGIARTPNLDRLAARGVLFRNAYCNNPICVPGRYSIMTGKYVRELGALHYGDGLNPQTWTYPKHFARAGYQTTCVGKQHFMGLEQMHGWMFRPYGDMELVRGHHKMPGFTEDPYVDSAPPGHSLADWVRRAGPSEKGFIQFDRSVTREAKIHLTDYFQDLIMPLYSPDRPLLYQVSYKTPHWPFWAPEALFTHYRERVSLPRIPDDAPAIAFLRAKQKGECPFKNSEDEILNARAANYALIEWVDSQIGEVLNHLQDMGILDDFLVIMHSDHGEMAGNHGLWGKGCAYEHSVRTPMLISWPGKIPQGKVVDTPVSNVDIFPTLCDYAGLETPSGLRGHSWRPLIDADEPSAECVERTLISEFFQGDRGWVMARRGEVKLVDYGYNYQENEQQLFDLAVDPDERDNLAGDAAYSDIQAALQAEIDALPAPFQWGEAQEKAWHTPAAGGNSRDS